MGFKVSWEDDDMDDDDPVFETWAEADQYALDQIGNVHTGAEVLHLSNPGDYAEGDDADPEYEIVEVD